MKTTINTTEEFKKKFKLTITINDQKYLDYFFSKKSIQFENNKIIHPKIEDINKEIDRKSVVQGKSVDLGGRRIIKKKTKTLIVKNRYKRKEY